jgi:hypothetical protein
VALTCTNCGSQITAGRSFCQACGYQAAAPASASPASLASPVFPADLPPWSPPSGGWASAADGPSSGAWAGAAAGPAGPNAVYLGKRLGYATPPETPMDPLGNGRFMAQLGMRAAIYYLSYYFAGFLSFLFVLIILLLTKSQTAAAVLFGFFSIVSVIVGLAAFCCFWFLKIPIQLSEWKIMIDGQGAAAPVVFNHIASVIYRRGTPIGPLRVQRFRLPNAAPRDYLELNSDLFYGYVACFGYGRDLYVGWTFWVRISPFRYLCMFIARLYHALFNRGNDLYVSLRYDAARAMREILHSATREGVDVAVGRLEAQGQGIVGTAIPVQDHVVTQTQ